LTDRRVAEIDTLSMFDFIPGGYRRLRIHK